MRTLIAVALVLLVLGLSAPARADCAAIEHALAGVVSDVHCVASADLTTRNADTTPPDNSRPGLPPNAFTPRTDAQAVSPDAPFRTPIDPDRTFPGLQVTGAMTDDANARWVLRLPTDWNGRLVVGVPGGLRSEFMGDFIFSDLVVQLGYAYVSTNKGMLNFFFTAPLADPAACRLSPRSAVTGTLFTHFYVDDPADTIREWFVRTLQAADVAELSLEAHYDRQPERVYLLGISNGGHVVRRMLSEFPTRFDGGVDWEGVYWSPAGPNILIDLPVALRNWEPYVASGFSRQSAAFQAMLGAGYPPDIFARPPTPGNTFSPVVGSHWETHANNYWDVTTCVFVRELDPFYPMNQLDPLGGSDTKDYNYLARRKAFQLSPRARPDLDGRRHLQAVDHAAGHDGRAPADQAPRETVPRRRRCRRARRAAPVLRDPERQPHRAVPPELLQLHAARVRPASRSPSLSAARRLGGAGRRAPAEPVRPARRHDRGEPRRGGAAGAVRGAAGGMNRGSRGLSARGTGARGRPGRARGTPRGTRAARPGA